MPYSETKGAYDKVGYPSNFSENGCRFQFAASGCTRQVYSWLHSKPYLFRMFGPRSENRIGNSERKLRSASLIGKSDRNHNQKFGFSKSSNRFLHLPQLKNLICYRTVPSRASAMPCGQVFGRSFCFCHEAFKRSLMSFRHCPNRIPDPIFRSGFTNPKEIRLG